MPENSRSMKPKEPIPRFASREEEAEFWDTHDLADYWQDFRPARASFTKSLSESITIRLDPETSADPQSKHKILTSRGQFSGK